MGEVNWAQLAKDAGDTSPVPIGKYDAICVKAELKKAAASGNEYWATQWKIQSGPSANRMLFNNFVLVEDNPNALRAFFINLRNLGITTEHLQNLGTDKNALTPMFVTRQAVLTVGHRPYQGQLREDVERVDPHPNGPIGSLSNIGGVPAANGMAPAIPQASVPVAAVPQLAAPTQYAPPIPAPAPIPQQAPVAAPLPVPAPAPVAPPAVVAPAPAPVPQPAPAPVQAAVPDDQAAAFAAWMASQQAAAPAAPAAPAFAAPQPPAMGSAPVPPPVPF